MARNTYWYNLRQLLSKYVKNVCPLLILEYCFKKEIQKLILAILVKMKKKNVNNYQETTTCEKFQTIHNNVTIYIPSNQLLLLIFQENFVSLLVIFLRQTKHDNKNEQE